MKDSNRGLYHKYNVTRTDGSSGPNGKHEHCRYFVLDMDHDPHALPALAAYEESCKKEYPNLAWDLREILKAHGHEQPRVPVRRVVVWAAVALVALDLALAIILAQSVAVRL